MVTFMIENELSLESWHRIDLHGITEYVLSPMIAFHRYIFIEWIRANWIIFDGVWTSYIDWAG